MNREHFASRLRQVFQRPVSVQLNFAVQDDTSSHSNQQQTNEVFSDKWNKFDGSDEKEKLYEFQRDWYLKLYGFQSQEALQEYLASCNVVLDAGCGLGYKAAWFAQLAPRTLVIGMDFSEAAQRAAETYRDLDNLFFIRGDIAKTGLRDGSVDYVSCDQVIMHTEDPLATFAELARIAKNPGGQVACYFYAKKALPRELLDDYFRIHCANIPRERLWVMSEQLAVLGRRLSELNVSFEVPDIPELNIKGGVYDIQRFIYWNFLKCFWNPQLGMETSVVTNFDWYSPSNARRFSEQEVRDLVARNRLAEEFFHAEEACYSGRFVHR
jgi:ubiquinone/menaquinone biosynthesis C-methylase UbiE